MPSLQSCKFCIVQNNAKINGDDLTFIDSCREKWISRLNDSQVVYMGFQTERGVSGVVHLQGFIVFKKPKTMIFVKNFLGSKSLHLDVMKGKISQSIEYCSKSDTRIGDYYSSIKPIPSEGPGAKQGARSDLNKVKAEIESKLYTWQQIYERNFSLCIKYSKSLKEYYLMVNIPVCPVPNFVFRSWQTAFIDNIKKPPVERNIYWLWSDKSRTGKTTLSKYVCSKFHTLKVSFNTSLDNVVYQYNNHVIIWFDITRSVDGSEYSKFLSLIESLSDGGLFTSVKYEGITRLITSHIVVSSNMMPPFDKLPDRIIEVCASLD